MKRNIAFKQGILEFFPLVEAKFYSFTHFFPLVFLVLPTEACLYKNLFSSFARLWESKTGMCFSHLLFLMRYTKYFEWTNIQTKISILHTSFNCFSPSSLPILLLPFTFIFYFSLISFLPSFSPTHCNPILIRSQVLQYYSVDFSHRNKYLNASLFVSELG